MQSTWQKVGSGQKSLTASWPLAAAPVEIMIDRVGQSVSIRCITIGKDGKRKLAGETLLFTSSLEDTLQLSVKLGKGM